MPRVYIIILNYKKWKDVQECLETLFRSYYTNFTVIVIDNHSENNSLQYLVSWAQNNTDFPHRLSDFSKELLPKPIQYICSDAPAFTEVKNAASLPQLVFIQHPENRGFAGGINPVLNKLLQEDAYIWLLNPDMVVEENTLSELSAFAAASAPQAIIGTVIKYYHQPEKIYLYAGGSINFNSATITMMKNKSSLAKMDYISGGSLFTHARNFKQLGLLPEDYFLYWEETDWCYRAKLNGHPLELCEKAVCYDKVSSSIGRGFLADYYYTRNGLLFLLKYKKSKLTTALFFSVLRVIKKTIIGQPARARGVYKGMVSFLNRNRHAMQ